MKSVTNYRQHEIYVGKKNISIAYRLLCGGGRLRSKSGNLHKTQEESMDEQDEKTSRYA